MGKEYPFLNLKLVPKVGLEPTRHHWRQILSLVRLPFRHFGNREMFRGASIGPSERSESLQYSVLLQKSSSNGKKAEKKPRVPPRRKQPRGRGAMMNGRELGRGQKRSARSFTTAFFTREGASAAHFAKCSSEGKSSTNRPGVMALSVIIFCAW